MSDSSDHPPVSHMDAVHAFLLASVPETVGPGIPPDALTPAELARAIDLAKRPDHGEPFELGGRAWRIQFPSIVTEELVSEYLGATPQRVLDAAAAVLEAQQPGLTAAGLASLPGVTPEALVAFLTKQSALSEVARKLGDTFESRRARWRERARQSDSPPIEVPPESAATAMLEWAARTYGMHPFEVRERFSPAMLLLMFDAHWWANSAMPPEAPPESSGGSLQPFIIETND